MNVDPRRSDKIQRYAPKNSGNPEDLTPDYMNIMGQPPTTANASGEPVEKLPDSAVDSNLQVRSEDVQPVNDELTVTSNAANVIPTSPQYGVAIIPNNAPAANSEAAPDSVVMSADNINEASLKAVEDIKDIHSTPSRNDRFKVVKIASLEPFKRGRWKCMDYVDEAPPANVANANKAAQSAGNAALASGVFLQTQSLPQQQIQQMLIQGGFTNGTQFFPGVPAHLIPQGQYFYPQVANVQNQTVSQQVATSMPAQFMNNQPYFSAGVVANPAGFTLPQSYPNIQYVPIQTQNSAFVPTSQAVHLPASFQQSQTYAGQPTVSQASINQNMVNGHAYPQHGDPQVPPGSTMPNQPAKNVIVNSAPVSTQPQQNHVVHNPSVQTTGVVHPQQYQQPQSGTYQPQSGQQVQNAGNPAGMVGGIVPVVAMPQQTVQAFDASQVYTNPQFAMNVNSLTVLEPVESGQEATETGSTTETLSENPEDPAKSNPVVNAIDNKIEQAMDLVKSHLMYTVREEVEVLKEKIAELMEKIQQLETENNYLRSQIPKGQTVNLPTAPQQSSNVAVVNPSPNVMSQSSNQLVNAPVSNPAPSQNQTIPSKEQTSIQ